MSAGVGSLPGLCEGKPHLEGYRALACGWKGAFTFHRGSPELHVQGHHEENLSGLRCMDRRKGEGNMCDCVCAGVWRIGLALVLFQSNSSKKR